MKNKRESIKKMFKGPSWLLFMVALILCYIIVGIHPGIAVAAKPAPPPPSGPTCERNISADVVALDQAFFLNRLGAAMPQGMIYALKGDVVPISGSTLSHGNARCDLISGPGR